MLKEALGTLPRPPGRLTQAVAEEMCTPPGPQCGSPAFDHEDVETCTLSTRDSGKREVCDTRCPHNWNSLTGC